MTSVVDGDIHDVVDNFGWRCRDWHMDWHRDMLDVRDGVVMWPQRANDVCGSATGSKLLFQVEPSKEANSSLQTLLFVCNIYIIDTECVCVCMCAGT